jgi:NADH:quinone reductase (non-electrogenic)
VALRVMAQIDEDHAAQVTLVDRNDYHQILTELPRVAAGTRAAEAVRLPLAQVLAQQVTFVQATITGFDFVAQTVQTAAGPLPYTRLVLALGSRPNDFAISGLSERALFLWSADDARAVWTAVNRAVVEAAEARDRAEQRRLLTVVIGGAGATGVELAGALAEELPVLARRHDIPAECCRVVLIEAGPTILGGSSPDLIARAGTILADLGVEVRTNAQITAAVPEGVRLKSGEVIDGNVFVWAGGVKAPALIAGSGLAVGHNGRIKVDAYLRVLDHPEIFAAGDVASVTDPETGHVLPPLAQIALEEGETVAYNLQAELYGRPLRAFGFHNKGFVVSVGAERGVADVAGRTIGGRLAHVLKEAIEWEYRQSVKHLRGWSPL